MWRSGWEAATTAGGSTYCHYAPWGVFTNEKCSRVCPGCGVSGIDAGIIYVVYITG